MESLRFDRHSNLLATYNGGVSYWRFDRKEEEKQELSLPYAGACLCGDVTPGGLTQPVAGGRRAEQAPHARNAVPLCREELGPPTPSCPRRPSRHVGGFHPTWR